MGKYYAEGKIKSAVNPRTLNPQPSTLNLRPATLNPQSAPRNPKPTTRTHNPQPATHNQQPSTRNPEPSSPNPQPTTPNPHPATPNPQPPPRNPQLTTSNTQPSTHNHQPSVFSWLIATLNHQPASTDSCTLNPNPEPTTLDEQVVAVEPSQEVTVNAGFLLQVRVFFFSIALLPAHASSHYCAVARWLVQEKGIQTPMARGRSTESSRCSLIRTSRLSIKNSLSLREVHVGRSTCHAIRGHKLVRKDFPDGICCPLSHSLSLSLSLSRSQQGYLAHKEPPPLPRTAIGA